MGFTGKKLARRWSLSKLASTLVLLLKKDSLSNGMLCTRLFMFFFSLDVATREKISDKLTEENLGSRLEMNISNK